MDARRWWLGAVGLACFVSCSGKNLQLVGEMNHGGEGETGNASGTGSTGGTSGTAAASGGEAGEVPLGFPRGNSEPVGEVFQEGLSEVAAVTADATTLYWVEHGSTDAVGNYLDDGRLLARDFGSDEVQVIADDLPGPVSVAVTTEHAFIHVTQYYQGKRRAALMRLPLSGGTLELVFLGGQPLMNGGGSSGAGVCYDCIVHQGATAYFPFDNVIYKMGVEDAEPQQFAELASGSLSLLGEWLYVQSDGLWAFPLDGGAGQLLSEQEAHPVKAGVDWLYGMRGGSGAVYLARMPIAGGPWANLAPKRVAAYSWALQIVDDLFFHDAHLASGGWQVIQGVLDDTASGQVVLELTQASPQRVWVGTHHGVFWIEGDTIRHVDNAVE